MYAILAFHSHGLETWHPMLRILGSARTVCDGTTRRELLLAGGLAAFGMSSLAGARRAPADTTLDKATGRSFGRAKACILLYPYGSPSQLETCDMKPEAPLEVRGEFESIASRLPGCDVCEYLPRMATVMDRVTVVRSLTHTYPQHSISFALTGMPQADGALDMNPGDARHWPFVGSVVSRLIDARGPQGTATGVPNNIALPFPISSRRPLFRYAGFQPAYLGSGYAPIWTEFRGQGTRYVVRPAQGNNGHWEGHDPYLGIEPDCRFEITDDDGARPKGPITVKLGAEQPVRGGLLPGITLDRMNARRSLAGQLNAARKELEHTANTAGHSRAWDLAYSLLTSPSVQAALAVENEPKAVRERYGMTLFGQSTLVARRLVEAGCRFVTVVWDEYGVHNTAWDTHAQHFERMRGELLPGFDMAYASLLEDLADRGMLDDTLVLCMSEHGRTPRITGALGGGRDHWSLAYSNWFAGGGIAQGRVIGKTDKTAGTVVDRPLSPKDILATVYHLLGFDPRTQLVDRLNRPVELAPFGEVVPEMLG